MLLFYIDPGTGSMLFTILIGAVSAGAYALRNALVKARFLMTGGRQDKGGGEAAPIVIFTDSKRYWNIFGPICDELERRGQKASYFTASPDDPALERTYEHVSCEFIGEGNKAFARMNMLRADIVLSTTPGLDVYQWKRSRDVRWYVHVPHAVTDLTLYRMFGIDYYDAVLLTGEYQERQVRSLEAAHGLAGKELVLVGSTQMDELAKKVVAAGDRGEQAGDQADAGDRGEQAGDPADAHGRGEQAGDPADEHGRGEQAGNPADACGRGEQAGETAVESGLGPSASSDSSGETHGEAITEPKVPTVLVAPSWGKSGLLSLYGTRIIDALLKAGYHVVVRPHPQSFTSEREMIDKLMAERPNSENLEWNRDNDNFAALNRADVMISDFSGVILDYALAFDRAVIYTEPKLDLAPYDACWLEEPPWVLTTLPRVGMELADDSIDHIGDLVERCLDASRFRDSREEAKRESWAYPGEATMRTVDYLMAKLEELAADEEPADA